MTAARNASRAVKAWRKKQDNKLKRMSVGNKERFTFFALKIAFKYYSLRMEDASISGNATSPRWERTNQPASGANSGKIPENACPALDVLLDEVSPEMRNLLLPDALDAWTGFYYSKRCRKDGHNPSEDVRPVSKEFDYDGEKFRWLASDDKGYKARRLAAKDAANEPDVAAKQTTWVAVTEQEATPHTEPQPTASVPRPAGVKFSARAIRAASRTTSSYDRDSIAKGASVNDSTARDDTVFESCGQFPVDPKDCTTFASASALEYFNKNISDLDPEMLATFL